MIKWLILSFVILLAGFAANNNRLRTILYVDSKTGKMTKREFISHGAELLKYAKPNEYMLVSLDVDNFKYINDIYGYETGNNVLKMISEHLDRILPGQLMLTSRVSADNFVFIAATVNKETVIKAFSDNAILEYDIRRYIEADYDLAFSLGIYVIEEPAERISAMIDYANIARKSIKGKVGNAIAEYTKEMNREVEMKRKITVSMESSLNKKEFMTWMQPKFSLSCGSIIGAEVLVRWNHPELGLIPPSEFIPLFEENGFIEKLDLYMFENTCRIISEWRESGITNIPKVSVNMSRVTLNRKYLVETLKNIVDMYCLEPDLLEIEITEGDLEKNTEKILEIIRLLKDEGFGVSIDDFGSGYSSLSILKDMPADVLKIDRKFISDTCDTQKGQKIINNVIRMSKELNLSTVAEGIETQEQAEALKNMGCDVAQGFYFSKPMEAGEFHQVLTMLKCG
ncbi:MAG: putative bifunctional diguanylate cyclase/phosphodiesterase [Anaerovoracaceae bacterium]